MWRIHPVVVHGRAARRLVDSAGVDGCTWFHGVRAPLDRFRQSVSEQTDDDDNDQTRNTAMLPHAWDMEQLRYNG